MVMFPLKSKSQFLYKPLGPVALPFTKKQTKFIKTKAFHWKVNCHILFDDNFYWLTLTLTLLPKDGVV